MDPKPPSEYVDDGTDWFFKNGRFERGVPPILGETDFEAELHAAGYRKICSFGTEFGFGLQISQQGDNYMVSLDYGDSARIIWIDSFTDYMEFMRQFGHLGTLAENSATRYYIEDAHSLGLDRDWGILREAVREVARTRKAVEDRSAARAAERSKA